MFLSSLPVGARNLVDTPAEYGKPETEPKVQERASRAFILRGIGVLLILSSLLCLLQFLRVELPWAKTSSVFFGTKEQAWVLGIWRVTGWAVTLQLATFCGISLFSGIQLFRIRRSGWIAALFLHAYDSLGSFLFTHTEQIHKYLGTAYASLATQSAKPDLLMIQLAVEEHAAKIEKGYRLVGFVCVCQVVLLLLLASEWWRFGIRRGWYARPVMQWSKGIVCLLIIAASATWAFWGAEYAHQLAVMRQAHAAVARITGEDVAKLSVHRKRVLTATLVRRLAAEKSEHLATVMRDIRIARDLSLLVAEDIPTIIKAARTSSGEAQKLCWELLAWIATPEAEECLREAVESRRDSLSNSPLTQFAGMHPARVPDFLLQLPPKAPDDKEYFIYTLRNFRDPRVLPVLIVATKDTNPKVRETAIWALSRQPCRESEETLLNLLRSDEIQVRGLACWGLHDIGTATSIPPLIKLLQEPDHEYVDTIPSAKDSLHKRASHALTSITGEDFGNDLKAWEKWWKESADTFDLRKSLVGRLFRPLPPPPIDAPKSRKEMFSHPFYQAAVVQGRAIRAIRFRNLRVLAPELARYLDLPEEQARCHFLAAGLLTRWGYCEGITWLIEWVDNDYSGGNRMFAIERLGRACGVNFFSDKARWKKWWKENRHRFPNAKDG